MKRYPLLLLLFATLSGYAQNTINNYEYVLVPEQYSFSKEVDQYGLNNLTKDLLGDKGFMAYFDDKNLPAEIANDRCKAMIADIIEKKGMFTTTLTLILKDCQGNVVFKGMEGKSREKDFKTSYNDALKKAFISLNDVPYTFIGEVSKVASVKVPDAVVVLKDRAAEADDSTGPSETLYAQITENGFQLIDTTPKKVLTLFKTSIPDCFIADNGHNKGVVLKKDGKWYFEYYENDKLISTGLQIKF
ncbi:hypothetical protein N180_04640 [Pedobacter antarcticus 4BY]|uniref:Uncharacterized protein n=2 Tax=Pedobacter antarcticus TaxID=34086 RepID=A0A081PDB4_9SPHI|nr:hypothetical protein [Pedobacter antarcticus]KEQ28687.1 hypothetical protein N180_04640 [Pedobacter antarcticus 4BY]SFE88877.1 hypothetical protein SAMN03003324_01670 [Pedobacter antarcticus]